MFTRRFINIAAIVAFLLFVAACNETSMNADSSLIEEQHVIGSPERLGEEGAVLLLHFLEGMAAGKAIPDLVVTSYDQQLNARIAERIGGGDGVIEDQDVIYWVYGLVQDAGVSKTTLTWGKLKQKWLKKGKGDD